MMSREDPLELRLDEILAAAPGCLINAQTAVETEGAHSFGEMVYDSRRTSPRCVFLCIKGERSDGHDFIPDVVRGGASLVIGDDLAKLNAMGARFPRTRFYAVDSSLVALQKIATHYRSKFDIPVIGLTGSSGKTTTKDLISSILKGTGSALITEGTLNNHWGVPQMAMRLRQRHKVAAFEMGTSGFGEIDLLASICQPSIGFITTIGASHLQTLKNEEGVFKAKRELFDWIAARAQRGKARTLLFNVDNPHLAKLHAEFAERFAKEPSMRLFTLSAQSASVDVQLVSHKPLGLEHRYGWEYEFASPWGVIKGRLPLPGVHNLFNAMSAAALALASGAATVQDIVVGLAHPEISKLRSNIFKAPEGAVIYDDSYNANPTSVAALFEAARAIRSNAAAGLSKTVAVVGDMLELGPDSASHHREMGRRAAQDGVDVLFATGSFAEEWVSGFEEAKGSSRSGIALKFVSHDDLFTALRSAIGARPRETLVLVKGSRGAKMDQLVERFKTPK